MLLIGKLARFKLYRPTVNRYLWHSLIILVQAMDIMKMLAELRSERDQIDEAILVMENLARGQGKRRGRPPKWMTEARAESQGQDPADPEKPARKKRNVSPEARRRMAEAQRKRWAAAKATETSE
jgi:hypothetical protein